MSSNTKPAKRGWIWPVMIVGLLVAGAGANLVFMLVAIGDPSSAVEPDYYNKSLHWDTVRAEEQHSEELGWSVSIAAQKGSALGAEVVAVLHDRSGVPLEGAHVEVEAFHNARSGNRLNVTLTPASTAGEYRVAVPPLRPGLWEFRVRVLIGKELYTHTLQQDVGA